MKNKNFLLAGLLASLLLAGVASFYASSSPDGLEKVAEDIGFIDSAKDHANSDTTLANYGVKGIENERLSTGLAGVIGVAATAAISYGLFYLIRRKNGIEK